MIEWNIDALDTTFMEDDALIVEKFISHYSENISNSKDKSTQYYTIFSNMFSFNIDSKIYHHKFKMYSTEALIRRRQL